MCSWRMKFTKAVKGRRRSLSPFLAAAPIITNAVDKALGIHVALATASSEHCRDASSPIESQDKIVESGCAGGCVCCRADMVSGDKIAIERYSMDWNQRKLDFFSYSLMYYM